VDGPNVIDLTTAGGRGKLRVLVPDVIVSRGDREVRLGTMQARLMAVLAAARRPVTTDWVVTALWPEADLEAGRNRLAALVHRIRQRLDLLPDELLRRTRDGLELDGHGWSIDAWTFWDLTAGSTDDRERALELYQSDLAGRQLAYDDLLEEQRERLRERWSDTVRALVALGRISAADAHDRAYRLGTTIELDP
jgi:DNA-binding SARP family transcriptional activator